MRTILKAEAGITGEVPKARIANITAYELCKLAKMEGKVPRLIYAMLHYEGRGRAVCNCLEETFSPNGDKDLTSLRLQLQTVSNQVSISLDRVPGGGEIGPITVDPPYTELQLKAVLKALQVGNEVASKFPEYVEPLRELDLVKGEDLTGNLSQRVGETLFATLFSNNDMYAKLSVALQSKPVALQLRFAEKAVALSRYPWELLHNGDRFLGMQGGGLQITRYITFPEPPSPLQVDLPLRVLFISPRPEEVKPILPDAEVPAVLQEHLFKCERLDPPTWDALRERLAQARRENQPYHIIHFDGHGNVDLVCPNPKCGKVYGPALDTCPECDYDLSWGTTPEGYLSFERENHKKNNISAIELRQLLSNDDPGLNSRLMVLSACRSGDARGESVFNGVAPSLIQAGIPSVVAMQGMVSVNTSKDFMQSMYENLAKTGNIAQAVNEAKWSVLRKNFFMPALYLRSSDAMYGQLFNPIP
jgi:hypothetical protein